ncbi:hypothetical protein EOK75_00840 [Pseudorhodobacter turbinis]|uniref:Hedgehog/Intein (Hint) domain-containing protein n=1 Tax=Pseudorhodobacter turbinis TaxID=2500533 RepID=A0A4P8ECJ1_9RHOB|nr:Hint domain-containing protein [Pseudorhodobacter turbinis]QCO54496.1 hypothetical protein EOK75_00840 [Pseudorhodobacter turbinis]
MTHQTAMIGHTSAELPEGVVAGTTVMTLMGEKCVESLKAGDRIITRSGARSLRAVHKTMHPTLKLVCISASALGVEQPEETVCVTPNQGILIRGWRAKALKGAEQAVFTACELADGEYIRLETHVAVSIFTLEFDHPEVIIANGVELACTPTTVTA